MSAYINSIKTPPEGVVSLAIETLKMGSNVGSNIRNICWRWIQNYVIIDDANDPSEFGLTAPMNVFANAGGVKLIGEELSRPDCSLGLMFSIIFWCVHEPTLIHEFIKLGVHKYAINSVKIQDNDLDLALSVIRELSYLEGSTRRILREDGALDAVLSLLDCLKSTNDTELRRGFRAGSVIARLAGNDESGNGAQIFRINPLLIAKTIEVLDRSLDAGPSGTVINMDIPPQVITIDLLTMSSSDANKPMLEESIPVLLKALKVRGESNIPMVKDIVKIFLHLSFDASCLKALKKNAGEISNILKQLVTSPKFDQETCLGLQNLLNTFEEDIDDNGKSKGGGLLRKVLADNPSFQPSKVRPQDRHIILSYHRGAKETVEKVDSMLRANGFRVWVD